MVRAVAGAAIALALAFFALVQFASEAFNSGAAAPAALPRHIPITFALRVYGALDESVPAPFVEATLSQWELDRGDLAAAERYALRLPPAAARNELLARIALRRGDRVLAGEYFFAAPDIAAMTREVTQIARTDPVGAYMLERQVRQRLAALQTHPDAVAEAHWRMGVLAASAARRFPPGSARRNAWLHLGLGNEIRAVQLSPLSIKYLLEVAALEIALGDTPAARRWYHRALGVDPTSAAALKGIRALALRRR
jgi:hypothetical protein